MGNSGSSDRHQTQRTEIEANAKVELQRLANARQQQSEVHQAKIKEIEVNAENRKEEAVHRHQQEMEKLAEQKQQNEHSHELKLKEHEREKTKIEADVTVRMEELSVEKQRIESSHKVEMSQIQDKAEARQAVTEVLKILLDKDVSPTDFAYKAMITSSALRNEAPDIKALELIGQHHRMLEEARLGITPLQENPRRQALLEPQDSGVNEIDEDDFYESNSQFSEISKD